MPTQPVNTTKHSINLRHGDYAAIQDSLQGKPKHASDIIRDLVSAYVDKFLAPPPIDHEALKNIDVKEL